MALLPVATNRVSTPLNNQRLLFQLNNDQLAIQRQYDQLSSGRRVLRLSDDPSAASRSLGLRRGVEHTEQLIRNADATEAYHQSTDVALDRIDQALISARGVAVGAAQNVISEDEREAFAIEVRQLLESVVTAGNSMFNDHQLLGGILQADAALEYGVGTVVFNGTDAIGQTNVGAGTATALTVSGEEGIGLANTFLVGESLDAVLNTDTRLVDMRQGVGVQPGVIELSDGGNAVTLDLRNAATIGDVVDVIESADLGGRSVSVQITNDAISLQYADGLPGTLAIADLQGGQLAADLQISNPGGIQAPPIVGDLLAPRVTLATPISDLAGGAGIDLSAGILIERGAEQFDIQFDGADTIGDVLIAINRSGAGVKAELNERDGRIELRALVSGVDYSIGENGGTTATELGIRSATEETLLSELSRDRGLLLNPQGTDLTIRRPDGLELEFELEGIGTIGEFMQLVRDHPDNQDPQRVFIELSSIGNGLELSAPPGAEPISVTQQGVSDAGVQLGWIPEGADAGTGEIEAGVAVLRGTDYRPLDAGGAVDTLLRLETAVRDGDLSEIARLQSRLDSDLDQASRTRGRVGVWNATVRDLRDAAQDENALLQEQLSDALDADLAAVVSELQARQSALEASMRFIGQASQLSVLNFI
ncbi:MAG: flagellin hook IN motif-containing protein [Planctomycetota bacterium]